MGRKLTQWPKVLVHDPMGKAHHILPTHLIPLLSPTQTGRHTSHTVQDTSVNAVSLTESRITYETNLWTNL